MTPTFALFILLSLFLLEIAYFKIADHFNIIDKPNHRSSHTVVTIRGGGIIFPIAVLLFFGFQYPYFLVGLMMISLVSFLDDILTLNNKVRFAVHLVSGLLMLQELQLFGYPWYWTAIALVLLIGIINAYNFMDGINGLTGSYSLLAIITLYYINSYQFVFTSNALLTIIALSLFVFNFFNFRTKSKCFAGDVGSISIAFIIVFLLGQLMIATQNPSYILLIVIYGLDSVTTIIFRLIRKENIFEAHRTHFYQFLSNQKKWPHLYVDVLYFFLQACLNFVVVAYIGKSIVNALILLGASLVWFLLIRFIFEGRDLLIGSKTN